MKFLSGLPVVLLALLTACGPSGSAGNDTAASGRPHSVATATATATSAGTPFSESITPTATVVPGRARVETYPYAGENGASISVMCLQAFSAESFTYTVAAYNLGAGTFSFGQSGTAETQIISPNGSIKGTMAGVNTDTIVQLEISATYYKNTLSFRGCEPFSF